MNIFKHLSTPIILAIGLASISPVSLAQNAEPPLEPEYTATIDKIQSTSGELNAFGYPIANLPSELKKLNFNTIQQQAQQGDKQAQFYLAKFYDMGIHVPMDKITAIKWYEKSAQQNYPPAMNNLAAYYSQSFNILGLASVQQKAIELWTKAAEQNYMPSIINLGHYLLSFSEEESQKQGIKWLEKATAQNENVAFYILASAYETGRMVEKNESLAFDYLKKSAEGGYAPAQYDLANRYQMGTLTTLNVSKRIAYAKQAHYWAKRACENGLKQACALKDYYAELPEIIDAMNSK